MIRFSRAEFRIGEDFGGETIWPEPTRYSGSPKGSSSALVPKPEKKRVYSKPPRATNKRQAPQRSMGSARTNAGTSAQFGGTNCVADTLAADPFWVAPPAPPCRAPCRWPRSPRSTTEWHAVRSPHPRPTHTQPPYCLTSDKSATSCRADMWPLGADLDECCTHWHGAGGMELSMTRARPEGFNVRGFSRSPRTSLSMRHQDAKPT